MAVRKSYDDSALLRTVPMALWPEAVRRRREMLELATARAETLLAELIDKLDAMEPDPDLEPSLGKGEFEITAAGVAYLNDDREEEETDENFGGVGDRTNQKAWGRRAAQRGTAILIVSRAWARLSI